MRSAEEPVMAGAVRVGSLVSVQLREPAARRRGTAASTRSPYSPCGSRPGAGTGRARSARPGPGNAGDVGVLWTVVAAVRACRRRGEVTRAHAPGAVPDLNG